MTEHLVDTMFQVQLGGFDQPPPRRPVELVVAVAAIAAGVELSALTNLMSELLG
ncbi:hypothetical protein [Micromonospora zamorensis]|uniref:hypothetical protein n=1 Tax=Micromonospora zamorensis TaxID=709883 RepID=UPI003CF7A741